MIFEAGFLFCLGFFLDLVSIWLSICRLSFWGFVLKLVFLSDLSVFFFLGLAFKCDFFCLVDYLWCEVMLINLEI